MPPDDTLLDDDLAARASALDTSRSFIVQAPAGSGKTELLIQRYLTLLAAVDEPEEVLAITFTRKAAAEMRLRVMAGLQLAARGEMPAQAHEQITARAARAVLDRSAARGWELLGNPRRLRVQTLDALNAAIARMQPLTTSASTFGSSIADEAALKALYRRAAAATLDWLDEPGALCDATREVLLHVDTNTSRYVAYLARMLETRDQWLPFVAVGEIDAETGNLLRKEFENSLEIVVSGELEALRASFDEAMSGELLPLLAHAADNLAAAGLGADLQGVGLDAGLPPADPDRLPVWQAIAEILQTRQGAWRKTVNKNQGFPPADKASKQAMLELLSTLGDAEVLRRRLHAVTELPPSRYSDEQWSVLVALFRLLPLAVAELHRLFAVRGVTDYIEIALTAGEALGSAEQPGDIALLLDYQLRHILIDEMQDTSKAQYRMLEALTGGWQAGDGRTLFCVGDPMQSIYRFRNAEVAQFLLARARGIAGVELQSLLLRRNFRSGARLVDWFNASFPTVLPASDEPATGAVRYSASIAAAGFEDGGALAVHPLFGSDVAAEADEGLRIITAILDDDYDDDNNGDVAVLVRSRTQLSALLARLRAAAIPYQAIDIDRLTDLPEIIDVLALTRAIAHPGDRLAWLAVLRSPAVGLDWTDLLTLVSNDSHKTVLELLNDEDRLAVLSTHGRRAITRLRPVFELMTGVRRTAGLRDRVERVWLQLGGGAVARDPQAIENVYRYLDVLSRLEIAGTLEDVAELEAQLDLERVSSDADARLKVMTMHRAKGLQFDHVLLYGLGRAPRQAESPVLAWFDLPDEHGGEHKVISPVGPRAELEHDPMHRFIRIREALKDRHEQARLLYVACTRARKSLHLLGHTRLSPDGESYRSPDGRSLLSLLWETVEPAFAAAFERGLVAAEPAEAQQWLQPRLRRLDADWQLPAARGVPGHADSTADVAAEAVSYEWVGAAARSTGTLVHRWLKLAADGKVRLQADSLAELRPAGERWLAGMGVGADSHPAILDRVDEALRSILADEKGQWLLDGDGHTELALSTILDDRVTNVIIDRVRIDAGTHWIVDYKTSTHEGGRLEYFLQEQLRRYRPQLEKYAAAYENWSGERPRCALYFPLLQRFVEVP